jgi:putative membrane protein
MSAINFSAGSRILALSLSSLVAFAQSGSSTAAQGRNSQGSQGGAAAPGQSNANNNNTGSSKMNSGSSDKMSGDKRGGGSLNAADRKFMMEAAEGGMMEVALGRLAQDKASNSDVKSFGQMMVTDHTQTNGELQALAQKKGVTLPAEKPSHHQATLSKLSGEPFDRAYIKLMQADHQKDVAEFQKQSQSGSDPELKAFAAKTLPTLQKHLTRVNEVAKNTSGGGANTNRKAGGENGSGTGKAATSGNNMDSQKNANKMVDNKDATNFGNGTAPRKK